MRFCRHGRGNVPFPLFYAKGTNRRIGGKLPDMAPALSRHRQNTLARNVTKKFFSLNRPLAAYAAAFRSLFKPMNDQNKRQGSAPRKRGAANPPARNGAHGPGKGRDARGEDPPAAERDRNVPAGRGSENDRPKGAAGALIELDRDLMKLLVRRSVLVSRIRGGRDHAASPAAIQAEKAVRIAWETGALGFSKDPRFVRQLFALLQDIKILTKEQAQNGGIFRLAPQTASLSGNITGPSLSRAAQMRIALAAALGRGLCLEKVTLCSALADTIKACTQAGAKISYEHQGSLARIVVEEGPGMRFRDKTIYVGEDVFSCYLMAFLAIGQVGACRFAGGSRLKEADLTPLRQVLPLFGARLAHVVPHSRGLPANLEFSGDFPALASAPAELPFEGAAAMLLAPLAWNVPMTLDLSALPAGVATGALAEVRPVHRESGAEVETRGPSLTIAPTPLSPPERPALPLDPVLSAYLLAMPLFTRGSLWLEGGWPGHMPQAAEALQLLGWAGGEITSGEGWIRCEAGACPYSLPLQCEDLTDALGPLYLALKIRHYRLLQRGDAPQALPVNHALFPSGDAQDLALAQDLCLRLGLDIDDRGRIAPAENPPLSLPAWNCPDANWGMAFALCSFMKPGLELANPGKISEVMPTFWGIFNSLPEPVDPVRQAPRAKEEEEKDDKPQRRRIITE